MSHAPVVASRSGQSDLAQSSSYALIIIVEEHPGSVDRVIGHLRRRRANMHTLALGRSEQPDLMRLTVMVNDSEVGVDHLVEQLRKIVDVRQVQLITVPQAIIRELALVRVSSEGRTNEILDLARQFGAYVVDLTPESLTLEIMGSVEQVESFVKRLRDFDIREVAYSGRVALARGSAAAQTASEQ
jgi:acetolactate synthase I/III small subunit